MRAKIYSYLINDVSKDKKVKGTKKCHIKIKGKFVDYENCLQATQLKKYKINYLHKK